MLRPAKDGGELFWEKRRKKDQSGIVKKACQVLRAVGIKELGANSFREPPRREYCEARTLPNHPEAIALKIDQSPRR